MFVVSTIVVKCSNRAAGSGAGKNGEQTDSTEFHLGQGEDGKEDSLTDVLFEKVGHYKGPTHNYRLTKTPVEKLVNVS